MKYTYITGKMKMSSWFCSTYTCIQFCVCYASSHACLSHVSFDRSTEDTCKVIIAHMHERSKYILYLLLNFSVILFFLETDTPKQ